MSERERLRESGGVGGGGVEMDYLVCDITGIFICSPTSCPLWLRQRLGLIHTAKKKVSGGAKPTAQRTASYGTPGPTATDHLTRPSLMEASKEMRDGQLWRPHRRLTERWPLQASLVTTQLMSVIASSRRSTMTSQ